MKLQYTDHCGNSLVQRTVFIVRKKMRISLNIWELQLSPHCYSDVHYQVF